MPIVTKKIDENAKRLIYSAEERIYRGKAAGCGQVSFSAVRCNESKVAGAEKILTDSRYYR